MVDTQKGQFRKKRANTKMETIERMYGKDFGIKTEKELANYIEELGCPALVKLLNINL